VLYCSADFPIALEILATAVIGNVYFGFALYRFRRVIFSGSHRGTSVPKLT
jgi:ABC-2 type transport system permease protein